MESAENCMLTNPLHLCRQKHTDYRGYQQTDEVVQWFWKVSRVAKRENPANSPDCSTLPLQIVREYSAEDRLRLLQFVTGTSRLPVNGFKDLQGSDGPRRFTLEKVAGAETGALPKSHTVSTGTRIHLLLALLTRFPVAVLQPLGSSGLLEHRRVSPPESVIFLYASSHTDP